MLLRSWDNSLGIATGWTARVQFLVRIRFFSSPQRLDRLWAYPGLAPFWLAPFYSDLKYDWLHSQSQSQSYTTTDGQPASLSWNKAPIWGLRPDLDYCLTLACLLVWGALSDERTGLPFAFAAGPCQRRLSRVRVPWDSRPYFAVSDLRLPLSSPPTTRRVTVEVFERIASRPFG
jgi:hypothetical protein